MISELAAAAQTDPDIAPSSNIDLKHCIRRAETHRKDGKALGSGTTGVGTGDIGTDLELAFIEYARAATLVVEKIPSHRDYTSVLSAEQRANLMANGEDILHQLGRLKATLVERYERYARSPSASADSVPAFTLALNRAKPQRKVSIQVHAQAQRTVADEAARWRAQREEAAARDAVQATASTYSYSAPPPSLTPGSSSSTAPSRNLANSVPYGSSPTSYSSSSSRTGVGPGNVGMPFPVPASLAVSGVHPTVGSHAPQPCALASGGATPSRT
ncbi:hypothetical protein C8R44DRAFT_887156 [Mycena epipterygia]|nr:hypothetical protein C8R44DRAFT_887156 [Mycena epipterygia]